MERAFVKESSWQERERENKAVPILCVLCDTIRVYKVACCIAVNAIHRFTHEIPLARTCVTFTSMWINVLVSTMCTHTHTHTDESATFGNWAVVMRYSLCVYDTVLFVPWLPQAETNIEAKRTKIYQHSAKQTSLKCVVDANSTHRHIVPLSIHTLWFDLILNL